MDRRYYSSRHFDRLSNGRPDTRETIAERLAHREACEKARADVAARFGTITPANAREAIAYQDERIRFHTGDK